jgi:chromate transporter
MTDAVLTNPGDRFASPGPRQTAQAFARYANFTLGGGSATIAVLHREIIERRAWLNEDKFALCFALCRLTPGTNLLAFCAGAGWLQGRFIGAVAALLAASIPCALIVAAMTAAFSSWQDSSIAQAAIAGAIAAAVAITVKTCWTIAKPHFKGQARGRVLMITAVAFLLYVVLAIPAIQILLLAAVIGAFIPPVQA